MMKPDIRAKVAASVAFGIAVLTLTTIASADPLATRQRISITGKGETHTFALTPVTAGALRRDSGSFSDCCWRERVVIRDGQKVEINDPTATLTGRRGTLVLHYRIEWVTVGAEARLQERLDAIAHSDGSRASVTSNLFKVRISNGILGSFWITPSGDTTLNTVAIYRINRGKVTTFTTVRVPDALVAPD